MQKDYHFIGIGGIGMSALARILLQKGAKVSGSDLSTSAIIESLKEAGAAIVAQHSSDPIPDFKTVVYNTMISRDNPEYQAAISSKVPLMHRSDLLALLMQDYASLLVTGTHGKTTTSSLLTYVLLEGGLEPSFAIGGLIQNLGVNGGHGKGIYFVAEADESDGSFLKLPAFGAIVTNIDNDHLDHWKTEEELLQGFVEFAGHVRSKEHFFWCLDDPKLASLKLSGISYGFHPGAQLQITSFAQEGWKCVFSLHFEGKDYLNIEIPLIGTHNALNAAAVFGLALRLKIPEESIRRAFAKFQGIGRRVEKKGEINGVKIYDDYGHHPTEIQVTLKALRKAEEDKRFIVVFQPHRYTRLRDCMDIFGTCFEDADELIITDLYAANEAPIEGINAEALVAQVREKGRVPVRYIPKKTLIPELHKMLRPHDVLLTQGAGDVTHVGRELLEYFQENPLKKMTVGVVFGGKSSEHEISLKSVRHVLHSLNPEFYDVKQFSIPKQGEWVTKEVVEELQRCDICFPVLHGPFGEDGSIQGFFETLGIAYVGCDFRSSAVCMDKAWTKHIALNNNIPTTPFVEFTAGQWKNEQAHCLKKVAQKLHFPLFVKPVHLGSSIGVSKAVDQASLIEAIDHACGLDFRVLVEEEVIGREIEFAVLGNETIHVTPPGEIYSAGSIYDYDRKYGPQGMQTEIQAQLPAEIIEKGKKLAAKAYSALGCTGMARVDCFLKPTGDILLSEVNPIPGFTSISLYPKMWEAQGVTGSALVDKLLILGLQRKRHHDRSFQGFLWLKNSL